mmetsp:Transcript_34745/g.98467  ORF Transcript_34745/g.98467 Transcript_34745/m.98467 type:complete len:1858 (+) Transcript_34745:177-5750(+)
MEATDLAGLFCRPSRMDLLERAKAENTVVVLRNGADRTLIAVELIKHHLLSDPDCKIQGPLVVFLCPSRELVALRAQALVTALALPSREAVAVLTGHQRGSHGSLTDRQAEDFLQSWEPSAGRRAAVLVGTPEAVLQALGKGYLSLRDTNLLVVDQCHHCCASSAKRSSRSPVARILSDHYHPLPPEHRPRVLGLMAASIPGKPRGRAHVACWLGRLQATMDCRLAVAGNSKELHDDCSPGAAMETVWYDGSKQPLAVVKSVKRAHLRVALAGQLAAARECAQRLGTGIPELQEMLLLLPLLSAGADRLADGSALQEEYTSFPSCCEVEKLCREIEDLVLDLGPLCGLLVLENRLGDLATLSNREIIQRRHRRCRGVTSGMLITPDLRRLSNELMRQAEFPLEELRHPERCAALSLVELTETVLAAALPPPIAGQPSSSAVFLLSQVSTSGDPKQALKLLHEACHSAIDSSAFQNAIDSTLQQSSGTLVTDKVRQFANTIILLAGGGDHTKHPNVGTTPTLTPSNESTGHQHTTVCFVPSKATATALAALLTRSGTHSGLNPRLLAGRGGRQTCGIGVPIVGHQTRIGIPLSSAPTGDPSYPVTRLLIACSTGDEEVDVQGYRAVVSLAGPRQPRRLIRQNRSARTGQFVALVPRDNSRQEQHLAKLLQEEETMFSLVAEHQRATQGGASNGASERPEGVDESDQQAAEDVDGAAIDEDGSETDDTGGALVVEATGAVIRLAGAVQFLNNICQVCVASLGGRDTSPLYWRHTPREPVRVSLGQWSPVHYTIGQESAPAWAAKASAALEMLRALHSAGLLDSRLSLAPLPLPSTGSSALSAHPSSEGGKGTKQYVGVRARPDHGAQAVEVDVISVPSLLKLGGGLGAAGGHAGASSQWPQSLVKHRLRPVLSGPLRDLLETRSLEMQVFKSMLAALGSSVLLLPKPLPPEVCTVPLGLRSRFSFTVEAECIGCLRLTPRRLAAAQAYHLRVLSKNPAARRHFDDPRLPMGPNDWTNGGRHPCYIIAPASINSACNVSGLSQKRQKVAHSCSSHNSDVGDSAVASQAAACQMVETVYTGANGKPTRYVVCRGLPSVELAKRKEAEAQQQEEDMAGSSGEGKGERLVPITSLSLMTRKDEPPCTFVEYYRRRYQLEIKHPEEELLLGRLAEIKPVPLNLEPPRESEKAGRVDQEVPEAVGNEVSPGQAIPGAKGVVYLVPELLRPVEAEDPEAFPAWAAAYILPYFLYSLEHLLVAHDLGQHLAREAALPQVLSSTGPEMGEEMLLPPVPPLVLLAGITASTCQRAADLERLETLGDSFLKWEVSCDMFDAHPSWAEGNLTQRRSEIVSNRSLAVRSSSLGLPRFLRSIPFRNGKHLLWNAPGLPEKPPPLILAALAAEEAIGQADGKSEPTQEGDDSNPPGGPVPPLGSLWPMEGSPPFPAGMLRLPFRMKVLGDLAESVVGAYLTHCGPSAGRQMLRLLGVIDDCRRPAASSAATPAAKEREARASTETIACQAQAVRPATRHSGATQGGAACRGDASVGNLPPNTAWGTGTSEMVFPRKPSDGDEGQGGNEDCMLHDGGLRAMVCNVLGGPHALLQRPLLLREALTHNSRHGEPSYERLEFLGDAMLDLAVTQALYSHPACFSPAAITWGRQAAVSNDTLARRCVELGLHPHIRHWSQPLAEAIRATAARVARESSCTVAILEEGTADGPGYHRLSEMGSQGGRGDSHSCMAMGREGASGRVGEASGREDCEGRREAAAVPRPCSKLSESSEELCKVCGDVVEGLIGAVFVEAAERHNSRGGSVATTGFAPKGRHAAMEETAHLVLGRIVDLWDCGAIARAEATIKSGGGHYQPPPS